MDGQDLFVGRETQLGALVSAVTAAELGEGAVAFVGGEAGIGKTRLVAEVGARVSCPVLWSRCWEGEGAPAFWPWQQLLRAVRADAGAILPLARYDHEVLGRLLDDALAAGTTDDVRFRLFEALLDVFATAAEHRSIALVIEDLHWADQPSIRLLQFIGRDPRARRLAIIGTYRDSDLDAGHPLIRCFADLADRGLHVSLRGLGKRDVTLLAGSLAGEMAVTAGAVSLLHRRTGGNPLFLRELLRLLDGEKAIVGLEGGSPALVPSSVRAVVAERLARLSARTNEVLGAAAVADVDAEFDVGTLLSLSTGAHDDVVASLEEAESAGLLRRTGDVASFEFIHAVVREVLYDELGHTVRASLHSGMAAQLEARGDPERMPQLAHHLLQGAVSAEDRGRAVESAVRAGYHNLQLLAYEEAVEWFTRALDILRAEHPNDPRQVDLHLALGEASLAAGDVPRARDAYRQAADLAARRHNVEQMAEAALGLGAGFGGFEVQLLDPVQVQLLDRALNALGPEPSVLRTWVLARLSVALSFVDSTARRQELSEAAVAMGRQVDDSRALGYALAGNCDVIAGPDSTEDRRRGAEEVIRLGVDAGDPRLELLGRRFRVVALLEMGEVGEADFEIERFAQIAEGLRQPLYRWYVPLWKGMRALMRREFDEAARWRAMAEEIGRRAHSSNATVLTFTQWWMQQRYEGRFVDAGAAMADLLGQEGPSVPPVTAGPRAVAATQIGDHDKARILLQQWRSAPERDRTGDSEWLPESVQLAEVAVLVGAREEAEILYRQLQPYAHRFCVEGIGAAVSGSVAWYLTLLAGFLGHATTASTYELEARSAHQRIGLVGDPPLLAGPHLRHVTEAAATAIATASLVHEGVTWSVSYAGRTARLRDSKGLRDIAVLLARPGEDVHCLELMGGADVGSAPGPALDQQARRTYERRIRELQEDIDEAQVANDPVRAERAEAELDALVQQLTEAFGLSGRSRATGSAAERARSAVGWRVRAAVRHASEVHPELALHLKGAVRTGMWCSYRPETETPWEIDLGSSFAQGRRA